MAQQKWHLTPKGPRECNAQTPATCTAQKIEGMDEVPHYGNETDAVKAWEAHKEKHNPPTKLRKTTNTFKPMTNEQAEKSIDEFEKASQAVGSRSERARFMKLANIGSAEQREGLKNGASSASGDQLRLSARMNANPKAAELLESIREHNENIGRTQAKINNLKPQGMNTTAQINNLRKGIERSDAERTKARSQLMRILTQK